MNFKVISMNDKLVWEGKAGSIHFSSDEEIEHHNSMGYILGHFDNQVTLCIAKVPSQLVMEKDHTLWLGEYDGLPNNKILWKFRPKRAK